SPGCRSSRSDLLGIELFRGNSAIDPCGSFFGIACAARPFGNAADTSLNSPGRLTTQRVTSVIAPRYGKANGVRKRCTVHVVQVRSWHRQQREPRPWTA